MTTNWAERHYAAIASPKPGTLEEAVSHLLKGWCEYADAHEAAYGSTIGEDGVLGEPWAEMGRGLLRLLNGDCGRLDCGIIDGLIRDHLRAEGFEAE